MNENSFDNPVPLEIDGVIDLHHFSPKDIRYLIPEYLEECRKNNIFEIRIIHGKGTGALRRSVHAILGRLEFVVWFRLAEEHRGSWGATVVQLSDEGDL